MVARCGAWRGGDALGLGAERGRVEAGLRADLVVVRDDPSDDIAHMRSVQLVLKDGRRAWARPGGRLAREAMAGGRF
jgi:imidazolonepropionase-like amidohydrolase